MKYPELKIRHEYVVATPKKLRAKWSTKPLKDIWFVSVGPTPTHVRVKWMLTRLLAAAFDALVGRRNKWVDIFFGKEELT